MRVVKSFVLTRHFSTPKTYLIKVIVFIPQQLL